MRRISEGLGVVETGQHWLGLSVGSRMTVMDTGDGLLVHSPVGVPVDSIGSMGRLRWVVCPNKMHHLHAGPWISAGAQAWAAPGLQEKRLDLRFDGVLGEHEAPFGPQIGVHPLRCFSMTNEVVFHHRPSRTLVVTDLVFHLSATAPWATRVAFGLVGAYPGCRTSHLERLGFDRKQARADIGALLALDADRLIMTHGEIIETGGREALERAMAWLFD